MQADGLVSSAVRAAEIELEMELASNTGYVLLMKLDTQKKWHAHPEVFDTRGQATVARNNWKNVGYTHGSYFDATIKKSLIRYVDLGETDGDSTNS